MSIGFELLSLNVIDIYHYLIQFLDCEILSSSVLEMQKKCQIQISGHDMYFRMYFIIFYLVFDSFVALMYIYVCCAGFRVNGGKDRSPTLQ